MLGIQDTKNRYFIQKLKFSHDRRGLKSTFSIEGSAESWVNVSRDLLEYSGRSGIFFTTYGMEAKDRKMLRNMNRATDSFCYLGNYNLICVLRKFLFGLCVSKL